LSVSSATGKGSGQGLLKESRDLTGWVSGRRKGWMPCGAEMVAMRVLLWQQDLGEVRRNQEEEKGTARVISWKE
jgi:hypothetical protein